MSLGISRLRAFPFTLSVIIGCPIQSAARWNAFDDTANAWVNPLDDGIGALRRCCEASNDGCSEDIGRYHRPIDAWLCVWFDGRGPRPRRPLFDDPTALAIMDTSLIML